MNNDTIVIYFTLDGGTGMVARKIAEKLDCKIIQLKYKSNRRYGGFLKYIVYGFQTSRKKKPPINYDEIDLSNYSTIVIGSPVWANSFSPPLRSFFSLNSIQKKKVAIFFTCGLTSDKAIKKLKRFLGHNYYIAEVEFTEAEFKKPPKNKTVEIENKIEKFVKVIKSNISSF